MLKGLIYFLLGFFLIGLIVIYELSVFEKDIDSLIAKFKQQNEIIESQPLTQHNANQIPTVVIIRPHNKHHSAQFERFLANDNNEKHSIRAFLRVKNFMNEIKPSWEHIIGRQKDESKNVLQPVFDVSKETENKMMDKTSEIYKQAEKAHINFVNNYLTKIQKKIGLQHSKFRHQNHQSPSKEDIEANTRRLKEHVDGPAYWVNGVPARTGKDVRKEKESANKITTKIGSQFMDKAAVERQNLVNNYLKKFEKKMVPQNSEYKYHDKQSPSKEDIEANTRRLKEHVDGPAYWVNGVPARTGKDVRKEKESANKITTKIGSPFMDKAAVERQNLVNNYLKKFEKKMVPQNSEYKYHNKQSPSKEDIEANTRRLKEHVDGPAYWVNGVPARTGKDVRREKELKYRMDVQAGKDSLKRRLAHINEPAYWVNGVPAKTSKDIKREKESAKITTKIGTPFMDVDHPTAQLNQRILTDNHLGVVHSSNDYLKKKVYDLIDSQLTGEEEKIRRIRSGKSYSDTLAEKWFALHGKGSPHYEEAIPSKKPRVHYGKSYSDRLLEKWERLHARDEPEMHKEKEQKEKAKENIPENDDQETQEDKNQNPHYKKKETSNVSY